MTAGRRAGGSNHLRDNCPPDPNDARSGRPVRVDAPALPQHLRARSKLTGKVTVKGKGNRPSFHLRSRSSMFRGAPVVTRLTRTMGFVEVSQSTGVPGSIVAPAEDVPDSSDVLPVPH
jgi:hypothetical protein